MNPLCKSVCLLALVGLHILPCGGSAQTVKEAYEWSSPSLQQHAAFVILGAKTKIKPNEFFHASALVDHTFRGVVSPNNDTLYSGLCIDLRESPQVLTVPDCSDRYVSVMMTDMRCYNLRVLVNEPGKYVLMVKGFKGHVPKGMTRVETESDLVNVVIRSEVKGFDDVPNVAKIQNAFKIEPLSVVTNNNRPLDAPPVDSHWVTRMQWVLDHSPALDPVDRKYADFIRKLKPTPENQAIGAKTLADLQGCAETIKETKGMYGRRDRITVDHRTRAASNLYTHLALEIERAAYPRLGVDTDGKPLVGDRQYTMTMPKDIPLNKGGFWSVTVYDNETKQFVPNDNKLYRIADKTAVRNADGGVTIHFGGRRGADKNWLPLPTNGHQWYVLIRLYEGNKEIVEGTWAVPKIVPNEQGAYDSPAKAKLAR